MSFYSYRMTICAAILLMGALPAQAGSIDSIFTVNNSSPNAGGPGFSFQTGFSTSAVNNVGLTSSFVHKMAFNNGLIASGGVAQVNKQNVNYDVGFTVQDPDNVGFSVAAESLMRGISSITQNTTGQTAVATGINFLVEADDSFNPPNALTTLIGLFHSTPGVSVAGVGSSTQLQQSLASTSLGSFVGTTSFLLRFNSFFTPTTNVFFQNGMTGFGEVNYGFSSPGPIDINEADLGHFLTFTATFSVPEPTSALLLVGGLCAIRNRRRSA